MDISDKNLTERFEFRSIFKNEADQAVIIEQICFPPNEACSEKDMKDRIDKASELCLVAVDKTTGKIAGLLNGLATDEDVFRDEFFTNAELYEPSGKKYYDIRFGRLAGVSYAGTWQGACVSIYQT